MKQFVYKNKFYICGKANDVTAWLKELAKQFSTVKELLDHYMSLKA